MEIKLKRKIIKIEDREKDYDLLRLEPLCIENPKLKNILEKVKWKLYKTPWIIFSLLVIGFLFILINIPWIGIPLFIGSLVFGSYSIDLKETIVKREENNDLCLYFLNGIQMKKPHNFSVGDIIEINIEVKRLGGKIK